MLLNKLEDDCNIGSILHETRIILSIKSSEQKIKTRKKQTNILENKFKNLQQNCVKPNSIPQRKQCTP